MEMTWLGHSCFRIRGREANIIMDPLGPEWGLTGRLQADIVTASHQHPGHNHVEAVAGDPLVITGPGEYESHQVLILGISTFHDDVRGQQLGKNTVFLLKLENMTLCHLGDLGHVPSPSVVEALGDVDILMVPVGGGTTLNAAKAAETVSLIEPKIVVPMHYQAEKVRTDLEPVEKFLKEMGIAEVQPQARLTVNRSSLPQETQVVLFVSRHT